ncbi:hypothetical protein HY605_00820 [Candidatus Peregrinibacteria bacterium]|nr:hypothetical protein [Candidatus Peregrinibacteria bacterium]
MENLGFKHICCDDIIEEALSPVLKKEGYKGIKDMAKWLGQPYDKRFKEHEKNYLKIEDKTLQSLFNNRKKANIVIDTTGSVIHTSKKALSNLKKNSLIVYIEASPKMQEEMFESYIKNPKPVVWGNNFKKNAGETNQEALKKSYKKLLKNRSRQYESLSDIIIPYDQIDKISENQFLELIKSKL